MIKVSDVVQSLIARSPFLNEALEEGLINHSALARKLRPEVGRQLGKEVKEGAVLMAIKRMPAGGLHLAGHRLQQFFRKLSDISVRSNLVDYTFRNSDTLPSKQARLLEIIEAYPNSFYTFSHGIGETTIITADTIVPDVEFLFADEQLLDKEVELSSITLLLPEENRSLYGIYYYILKELAWHGINLIELISTSNEFTIIVRDSDLDRSFQVLIDLKKS